MLGGLSPNVISLSNTLLASLVAGALGILAASITQLDPQTLPLLIIPALAGIAVAVVLGLITAVSAVRVRGVSLAVVTLAGAVAIENFGFVNSTWGGGLAGSPVPEPKWFGLDLGPSAPFRGIDGNLPSPVFGWVVLICCVLLCVAVGYIRRGTLGQRMLAVRSNERAAAAAAINPRTVKLADRGQAMLLIEHDMGLVLGICDRVIVLEFGQVIAEGPPDAVRQDPRVIAAYLGHGTTSSSGTDDAGTDDGGIMSDTLAE